MAKHKLREYTKNWMDFEEFKSKFQKVDVKEYPNNVLKSIPDPKVSVLITTYQHAKYIKKAIESVLMQKTDFPFEIIIGDDESTDGTREICIEYATRYPDKIRLFLHKRENNIKVFNKPCLVFQLTYNLFHLRGNYIASFSGDDYWSDPDKLQKQYDFMSNNPGYSYCRHAYKYKSISVETTSEKYSNVLKGNRIQTYLYINIFDKLPKEFLETLNEDVFIKYLLNIEGKNHFCDDIKPAICVIHDNNIWGLSHTLNQQEKLFKTKHRINTWQKIYEAFKNTQYENELIKKLESVRASILLDILRDPQITYKKKIRDVFLQPIFYREILKSFIKKMNI